MNFTSDSKCPFVGNRLSRESFFSAKDNLIIGLFADDDIGKVDAIESKIDTVFSGCKNQES